MNLHEFYSSVFAPWFLRSRSPRTKCLYETTIRNFRAYLKRDPELTDLQDLSVNGFLGWLKSRDLSPFTINKERSNLLAIWRFAARKSYVKDWPDVPTETEPETIPMAWQADEIQRLFAAANKALGLYAGVPCAQWWKMLLLVLWDTGERIGAIRNLAWPNVDLRRGWLHVPAKFRKGGRSDKLYKLSPETLIVLRESKKSRPRDLIFPWPYSETYLWRMFGKLLDSAGLESDARSKFHRLRRSVASHYEAAGGDATELLGHSERKVTTKHYLDPRIVGVAKPACDLLFRPCLEPEKTK
jgi:integrase